MRLLCLLTSFFLIFNQFVQAEARPTAAPATQPATKPTVTPTAAPTPQPASEPTVNPVAAPAPQPVSVPAPQPRAEITYQLINIHPPESPYSYATDINNNAQIVGFSDLNQNKIFLWSKDLGLQLIGSSLKDPKINNLGHVVGTIKTSKNLIWGLFSNEEQLFIWKPETGLERIDRPKIKTGSKIDYFALNDLDQILVTFDNDDIMLWQEGKYEKIEGLDDANYLSNQQIISGSATVTRGKKIYYTPVQYDINLHSITYINDTVCGEVLYGNEKGETVGEFFKLDEDEDRYFWNTLTDGFKELPKNFEPFSLSNRGLIVKHKTNTRDYKSRYYLYDGKNFFHIPFVELNNNKLYINDHGEMAGAVHDRLKDQPNTFTSQAVMIEQVQ